MSTSSGPDPTATVAPLFGARPVRFPVVLRFLAGLSAIVLVASCGGTELDLESTFDGQWVVTELRADGADIDLGNTRMVLSIITTTAAVEGLTGCHEIFGSYTLIDDGSGSGAASFTMPGTSRTGCSIVEQGKEDGLIDALESVTQWEADGVDLVLIQPGASDPDASRPFPLARDLVVLTPVE